jgi:hypothetical protein
VHVQVSLSELAQTWAADVVGVGAGMQLGTAVGRPPVHKVLQPEAAGQPGQNDDACMQLHVIGEAEVALQPMMLPVAVVALRHTAPCHNGRWAFTSLFQFVLQ